MQAQESQKEGSVGAEGDGVFLFVLKSINRREHEQTKNPKRLFMNRSNKTHTDNVQQKRGNELS